MIEEQGEHITEENKYIKMLSGIPENSGYIIRSLNTEAYWLRYDKHTGGIYATDQGGDLMTRGDLLELIIAMNRFFSTWSDDDIIEFNHESEETRIAERKKRNVKTKKKKKEKPGWIYLVMGQNNQYKIGMTTREPTERLAEFCPKLPFETSLIMTIKTKTPKLLEAFFHHEFEDKNINGEWFELSATDIMKMQEYQQ